jgi:RNA polymerase sigma-70 factor (ECF subfamily)
MDVHSAKASAGPPGVVAPGANGAASREAGGSSAARELESIRRAQSGDRAAFGDFVQLTQARLFTLLVRIMGDREEARELSQEAYLKALMALPSFRNGAAPYTWLYRIGVNLAIGRLRKVRRHRLFSLDLAHGRASEGSPAADEPTLRRERDQQVLSALGRLDSEYRAVLVMRDVDGLDYKDISDVLELPIGTVKSRIFRARLALREELLKYAPLDLHGRPAGRAS